jgi:Fe-S-cluster containining protein
MECLQCGTCCVAPDISSLGKPMAVPCIHLDAQWRCSRYETRPPVCRGYQSDDICRAIAAPGLEERVEKYLRLFGLDLAQVRENSSGIAGRRAIRHRNTD